MSCRLSSNVTPIKGITEVWARLRVHICDCLFTYLYGIVIRISYLLVFSQKKKKDVSN